MTSIFWTIAERLGKPSRPSPRWHIIALMLVSAFLAYLGEPVPTLVFSAFLGVVLLLLPFHGAYMCRRFWRASRPGLAFLFALVYFGLFFWLLYSLAGIVKDLLAA